VKLLPATVCDPSFLGWLRERMAASGLEPDRLVLQIAHRSAIAHSAETRGLLQSLRAAGFRTALEHYAETDSTHPLLSALALDFVKLSRQLTQDMTENRQHQQQVQAITGRCRALEIHSVAALVQDALTLSTLWSCGVEYIQGYFMQEPADVFDTAEQLT
jgi:EAL domain-containing protein (putative c-di-GMP-specific phosphodiesterase class I)